MRKIIHLIWFDLGKGPTPHGKYLEGYNAWIKHNPNCDIVLWNQQLIDQYIWTDSRYDFFRTSWNRLDKMLIQRLDMIRPILLDKYGGMYGDLDFVCTRSVEPLFDHYLSNQNENKKNKIVLMKTHLMVNNPTN